MFGMFRRWLSGFKSRNRSKFEIFFKMGLIALVIAFFMSTLLSNRENTTPTKDEIAQTVYKPQETVILGSNVEKEEYKQDKNAVDIFINYCNEGKADEAYKMLTDECKENLYPTLQDFIEQYCNKYFSEKKDYNLQSWVNTGNSTTYKMRITQDMLSTGEYTSSGIYEDYITIVEDGDSKKININGFIQRIDINKTTSYEGMDIKVNRADVYMDYEEYSLEVINNTPNIIMLDSMLQSKYTLRLIANDGNTYPVNLNSINYIKLIANPTEKREIKIKFNKKYSSNSESKYIEFSKIVKNYNQFIKNQKNYNDFISIKVEL